MNAKPENTNIDFIYLDVGGVAILDFSKTKKWEEMLDDLEVPTNIRKEFGDLFSRHETEICIGRPVDDFIVAAQTELGFNFPEGYSMLDDFVDRFEPNPSLGVLVKELSRDYRFGLLTNMYPGMLNAINQRKLLPEIEWEVIIDSSIVEARKPQDKIYEIAEEQANVTPEVILFVENSQMHIDAAKERGWQTLLYDPSKVAESNKLLQEIL